jgi:hypothetical protein
MGGERRALADAVADVRQDAHHAACDAGSHHDALLGQGPDDAARHDVRVKGFGRDGDDLHAGGAQRVLGEADLAG